MTKADSFASKKGGSSSGGVIGAGGIIANNNYVGTRIIENNSYNNNVTFIPPVPLPPVGLKVMLPIGTKQFFQSIRHFVRRDHFRIQVIENSVPKSLPLPPAPAVAAVAVPVLENKNAASYLAKKSNNF